MGHLEIVLIVAMIAANAVFAAYEIALASVSMGRLQMLAEEGRRGAAAALRMKRNMEASLAVVQLGITLVGVIAAATGGAGAEESIAPKLEARFGFAPRVADLLGLVIVVVPLTVFTIVLGELVPKVFTLRNKEWVCLVLSPPMKAFGLSVWPAVRFFEACVIGITRLGERVWRPGGEDSGGDESAEIQELRAVASLARMSRLIGHREEKIIVGAARLSSRRLREIAWPADAIRMLNADDRLDDALVSAHLDMHTRFPIAERPGDPQSIAGYANFKDIVASLRATGGGAPTVRSVARAIPSFDADLSLSAALEAMMRENNHIALVRESDGAVAGMITLEDILEELLGDIMDEYDRLPVHLARWGSGWIAGGGIALDALRMNAGLDLEPGGEAKTLADWIDARAGAPLHGGEVVELDDVRILVRKIRRGRALEVQIVPSPNPPESASLPSDDR